MRRRYSGDQPNEGKWSIANPGDTGEVLQTAMELGAKTDLLDEAWWLPMVFIADPGARVARLRHVSVPGPSTSTATGKRFCNESNSYVEVGKAMYANKAVPCWQVFDEGYVGRYVSGANPLKKRTPVRGLDRRRVPSSAPTPSPTSHARSMFPPTRWRRRSSASTGSRPRAWIPTSAAASRRTTSASAIPAISPNAALGPLDRRRSTPPGCSRPTSGPAGD